MKITDASGRPITVGTAVNDNGVVTALIEPDYDVNSFGRPAMYGPYVAVKYPDCDDRFVCDMVTFGDDENFVCHDVVVV